MKKIVFRRIKQIYFIGLVFLLNFSQILIGKTVYDVVSAPSLKDNIIGEDTLQTLVVYLPPSYESTTEKFPVLYFLPGWGCTYLPDNVLPDFMNSSITETNLNEFIVVRVPGCNVFKGTFYGNSPVIGNWIDFIAKDVVNYIDNKYRTLSNPDSRGIGGHSMGGYGAMDIAMKNPSIFGLAWGYATGLSTYNGFSKIEMMQPEIITMYLNLDAYLSTLSRKDALQQLKDTFPSFNRALRMAIGYGSAFSPDTVKNAPYVKYPYYKSGNDILVDSAAWYAYYKGFGGIDEEISQYKDSLMRLKLIYNEYGKSDDFKWIKEGCQYYHKKLNEFGISNILQEYYGGHLENTRLEKSMLPIMAANFIFDPNFLCSEALITGIGVVGMDSVKIDQINYLIDIYVQPGTDVTQLKMRNIYISSGASCEISNSDTINASGPVTIKVTSEDGTVTKDWILNVTESVVSNSINSTKKEDVSIYPVPATNFLNIDISKSSVEFSKMIIYNELGKEVLRTEITENKNYVINTSGIGKGLFIVKLYSAKLVLQRKVIIK